MNNGFETFVKHHDDVCRHWIMGFTNCVLNALAGNLDNDAGFQNDLQQVVKDYVDDLINDKANLVMKSIVNYLKKNSIVVTVIGENNDFYFLQSVGLSFNEEQFKRLKVLDDTDVGAVLGIIAQGIINSSVIFDDELHEACDVVGSLDVKTQTKH